MPRCARCSLTALSPEVTVPDWMACRELFWHPEQTPAQWAHVLELRMRYEDDDGVVHVSPFLGEEYRAEALSNLLAFDCQYSGMEIPQQLALLEMLGWMQRPARCADIDSWLSGVSGWLHAQPHREWLWAEADDSRHAHALPWLYRAVDSAPLARWPVRSWAGAMSGFRARSRSRCSR